MEGLLKEILEIPKAVDTCYRKNKGIKLPEGVFYLGMGASYCAALTLFYCGKNINPQIASEYYYLSNKTLPLGVLISQSGETSEIIWAQDYFKRIIAITNNPSSALGKAKKSQKTINLFAGEENFSSTKTFINTLIVLYLGLGIDPLLGINAVEENFDNFKKQTKKQAEEIFKYITFRQVKGLYIIGSGPNIGTAHQGALVLSELIKFSWTAMSVAQYDHGPKETAENTVVLILNSNGKDKKRIQSIKETLVKKSNALIIELAEKKLPEQLTPLTFIVQLDFLMNYLADCMNIKNNFQIGGKVTKVSDSMKWKPL